MKPPPFEYFAPDSLDEALALLDEHGMDAKILAGGQSLIPAMNFRLASPSILIDLNGVSGLDGIEATDDGGLRIKAMTRQSNVERDPLVATHAPLLHETMPHIAHPQIRNRGTIGGSIVHADPAAELPAIALALDATFVAKSVDEERTIKADEFFYGLFAVDLMPGEMITEIILPPTPPRTGYAFTEIARRHGDYAMMGVAVSLELSEDGTCGDARIVYLSVGDKPTDAPEAAAMLAGEKPSEALFAEAAHTASQDEMDPFGDIHASEDYKRHLANVLTQRALITAHERAAALVN